MARDTFFLLSSLHRVCAGTRTQQRLRNLPVVQSDFMFPLGCHAVDYYQLCFGYADGVLSLELFFAASGTCHFLIVSASGVIFSILNVLLANWGLLLELSLLFSDVLLSCLISNIWFLLAMELSTLFYTYFSFVRAIISGDGILAP